MGCDAPDCHNGSAPTGDKPFYKAMCFLPQYWSILDNTQFTITDENSFSNKMILSNLTSVMLPPPWFDVFMMTSSNGNIVRVTGHLWGEFTVHRWIPRTKQRPVTRSFDVFFDLRLNKRLSKQSWGWWFDTPSRSLWRHCNIPLCLKHWPLGLVIPRSSGIIYFVQHSIGAGKTRRKLRTHQGAWLSNYIPQHSVVCNYLAMS